MTTTTRTFTDNLKRATLIKPHVRLGGPRRRRPIARPKDWYERFSSVDTLGSHMPLDTDIHWDWRNPLNIIPAFMLLVIVIAVVGVVS